MTRPTFSVTRIHSDCFGRGCDCCNNGQRTVEVYAHELTAEELEALDVNKLTDQQIYHAAEEMAERAWEDCHE